MKPLEMYSEGLPNADLFLIHRPAVPTIPGQQATTRSFLYALTQDLHSVVADVAGAAIKESTHVYGGSFYISHYGTKAISVYSRGHRSTSADEVWKTIVSKIPSYGPSPTLQASSDRPP